jgi:hypothetical protein
MTDALYRGRENLEGLKQSFLYAINISSIADPQYTFDIGTFSRDSIREHLGRFIVDCRSLILFSVDKIGSSFRACSLKKVLISINTSK